MPTYEVTDSVTGSTIEMDGDHPPTQADVEAAFLSLRPASGAGMASAANAAYSAQVPNIGANLNLRDARAAGGQTLSLSQASPIARERPYDILGGLTGQGGSEAAQFTAQFRAAPVGQAFQDRDLGAIVKTGENSFQRVGQAPQREQTAGDISTQLMNQVSNADIGGALNTIQPGFNRAGNLAVRSGGMIASALAPQLTLPGLILGATGEIAGQAMDLAESGQDPRLLRNYDPISIAGNALTSRISSGGTAPSITQGLAQGALEGAALQAPQSAAQFRDTVQAPTEIDPNTGLSVLKPESFTNNLRTSLGDALPMIAMGAGARGSHAVLNAIGDLRRPSLPYIVGDHPGYTDAGIKAANEARTLEGNQALTDAFQGEQRALQGIDTGYQNNVVDQATQEARALEIAKAQEGARSVESQQRAQDFDRAKSELAAQELQQIKTNQLAGPENIVLGDDPLKNRLTAIETRPGESAAERARVEAQQQAQAPKEVPYLPPVEMSSQARRMTDQYARSTGNLIVPLGSAAAGGAVGAGIGATQGDTPQERALNSIGGLIGGGLAGGLAGVAGPKLARLAQPELNAGEQVLAKAAEAKRPALANIVAETASKVEGNPASTQAAANALLQIPKLPTIAEATAQQSTLSTIKDKLVSGLKKAGKALTQGDSVPKFQGDYASTPDAAPGGPAPIKSYSGQIEGPGGKQVDLFHLDQPVYNPDGSMAHPAGSDVSRASLEKLGFTVPEPSTLPPTKGNFPTEMTGEQYQALRAQEAQAPNLVETPAGTRDLGVSDGTGTATPHEQAMLADWQADWRKQLADAAGLPGPEADSGGSRSPQLSGPIGSGGTSGKISKELGVRLASATLAGVGGSFFGDTPDKQILDAAAGAVLGFIGGGILNKALQSGASNSQKAFSTAKTIAKSLGRIDLPAIDTASENSAQKVVEYAGARESAGAYAEKAKAEVSGKNSKNPEFKKRVMAFLLEDQLRGERVKFEQQAQNATDLVKAQEAATKAENVATTIGHKNGVFKTEADFQAALNDPEIQAAVKRFDENVSAPAEEKHIIASGYNSRQELEQKINEALEWNKANPGSPIPVPDNVLSVPGLNSGVYVNLENVYGDAARELGEKVSDNLLVGDIVKSSDRNNFGRVMDGGDGKVVVRFVNPETGATSTVDLSESSLKKTTKTQIPGEEKIDIYNARNAPKGNLENPIQRRSAFSKERLGTGQNYSLDLDRTIDRMVKGNYAEAAKRQMYKQLEADGLGIVLESGQSPSEAGVFGGRIPISKRSMSGTATDQYFYPRKDIEGELRQALSTDGPLSGSRVVKTVGTIMNGIQVKSFTDPFVHVANSLFTIAGAPGGETALIRAMRKVPVANLVDAGIRMVAKSRAVTANSPEIIGEINKLGEVGSLRPEYGEKHFMQTIDKAGRLVLQDLYESRVAQYGLEDTPQARRKFVGQLGQYNPRLMDPFSAILKQMGLSPFIVAGKNFNAIGARRLSALAGLDTGAPGTAPQTLSDSIKMRAGQAVQAYTTLLVTPFVANSMLWGDPLGPEGTPFGMVALTAPDKDGKQVTFDPAQTTLLRRGMRLTGVNALINGLDSGDNASHIVGQAVKDILASSIHPYAGPLPTFASTAVFGSTPSFHKAAENVTPFGQSQWNGRQLGENVKAAFSNINPMQGAFLDEASSKEAGKEPSVLPTTGVPIVDTLERGAENAATDLIGAVGLRNRASINPDIGELHQAQDDRFDASNNRKKLVESIIKNSLGQDGRIDMSKIGAQLGTPELQKAIQENPLQAKLLENEIRTAIKDNLKGKDKNDMAAKFTVADADRAKYYLNHLAKLSPEEGMKYLAEQRAKGDLTRKVFQQMNYLRATEPAGAR